MVRVSPPAATTERFASGGLPQAFGPVITHSKGVPLHSLSVSEDGTRIAAGSEHGDIFTWDAGDRHQFSDLEVGSRVLCLAWQPGQDRLASGNRVRRNPRLAPFAQRDSVQSVKPGESAAANDQTIWRVRWSRDGKKLASSSHTGAVQVWEPDGEAPPRLVGKMPDYALGLAWSPDDAMLAAGSTRRRDLALESRGRSGAGLEDSWEAGEGTQTAFRVSRFCPGERFLLHADATARYGCGMRGPALRLPPLRRSGAFWTIWHIPRTVRRLAAVGTDGYLRVWESDGLVPSLAVPLHQRPVAAVAWNGERIFTASEDGTVRILELDETKWKARARQIIGVAVRNPSKRRPQ